MQFVNEQQNISILLDLIHDRFDTLFKLTAVFCSGNHQSKIKCDQFFLAQIIRNFSFDNRLSKSFYNRCFTNTCFSH